MTDERKVAKSTDYAWLYLLAVFALGAIALGVWWVSQPSALVPSPTKTTQTGQVIREELEEINLPVTMQITRNNGIVEIASVVQKPNEYEGKTVTIQGTLSHRTRTGYGWNLKFDLFDSTGNSIQLNGVEPGTATDLRYAATGLIRAGVYGPEMGVSKLERIG